MHTKSVFFQQGIPAALGAAILFGASTPLTKLLLANISPWMLAGLLYLGSGLGLWLYRRLSHAAPIRLPRHEICWLSGAVLSGGVIAPVLLLLGLAGMPASGASLLLNAEGVFTALLAWFVFHENVDRRITLGMFAIVMGAVVLNLNWSEAIRLGSIWPALAILGACFAWGLDNNLTRKVSLNDATGIATIKGLVSGIVNLILALLLGATLPDLPLLGGALVLGFLAYGVSLTLFVLSLRHLGTARTGAYFSIAPFFGAALSIVLLNEPLTTPLLLAGLLMAIGVWLHLTERHVHAHQHETLEHTHEHTHDLHHQHEHANPIAPGIKHSHWHKHEPLTHSHAHFPDAHHQHRHEH